MPNHITNRIAVYGSQEETAKLFDFIKSDSPDERGEYALFDFNKIVPMPASLDIESSSEAKDGMQYLLYKQSNCLQRAKYASCALVSKMEAMKTEDPERFARHIELGKQYLRNIADHGYSNWYEWRCDIWGTKWNAYEIEKIDDHTITFQTAWGGVPGLIRRLAKKFPNVKIEYDFADEDTSYNVGSFVMAGDDVQDNSPADASPEAWALVFDLGVADPDDYEEQPDGTYKYKEDEE